MKKQGQQQPGGPAGRYNDAMRTAGKKRAIRNAFFRIGLHTTPKAVVHALAQQGIVVDEELVRLVRFGLLKETTNDRFAKVPRPVTSPAVRRRPQEFPGR
jgi:hypothetical protein